MEQKNDKNKKTNNHGGKRPGAGRKKILGRSHILSTPIPDALWDKLAEYSRAHGMTKNAVIVSLLESLQ